MTFSQASTRPAFRSRDLVGFSLAELLSVLVIIGILAGLISFAIPQPSVTQAANGLVALLEDARARSLALGETSAVLVLAEEGDPERLRKLQQFRLRESGEGVKEWEPVVAPVFLETGVAIKESDCTSDKDGTPPVVIRVAGRGTGEGDRGEKAWMLFGFDGSGAPLQPGARIRLGRSDDDGSFILEEQDLIVTISKNGRGTPPLSPQNLINEGR